MTLKVDRFEVKRIGQEIIVKMNNNTAYYIKDHSTDEIVSYVKISNNKSENKELADMIMQTIEEFIEAKNE